MLTEKRLQDLYNDLLSKYNAGLSSTSTKKFDDTKDYLSNELNIPQDSIYITGSGTRAGNLEVRLSQGQQANQHTTLGVAYLLDKVGTDENVTKLTNSAFTTAEKYIGASGKAEYDNILVIVVRGTDLFVTGLMHLSDSDIADPIKKAFPRITTRPITPATTTTTTTATATTTSPTPPTSPIASTTPTASTSPTTTVSPGGVPKAMQTIYFGAPGSGKSHTVEGIVDRFKNENTFRVTFHPDSDYASFVGSYKPVAKGSTNLPDTGIDKPTLLNTFISSSKYPKETKARYLYEGLVHKRDIDRLGLDPTTIASELKALGFTKCTYVGELNIMFSIFNWLESEGKLKTSSITYDYIPQAFTNAYVKAWMSSEPVFLVIEEINRGNCAQIFGDLFQLLDRKNGVSEYGVKADTDLKDYLESVLGVGHEGIKNGELHLPDNLYILATMNTSDQSLFPMDSAFKRRWDWIYVPIEPENPDSQFVITIGKKKYEWKEFLIKANEHIKNVSESEDKQMGNFFIKDDINEDDFVSKVMFYLWSEVCKDEYHARSFFHWKDGNNDEFSFNQLFKASGGQIDTDILQGFMNHIDVHEKP